VRKTRLAKEKSALNQSGSLKQLIAQTQAHEWHKGSDGKKWQETVGEVKPVHSFQQQPILLPD